MCSSSLLLLLLLFSIIAIIINVSQKSNNLVLSSSKISSSLYGGLIGTNFPYTSVTLSPPPVYNTIKNSLMTNDYKDSIKLSSENQTIKGYNGYLQIPVGGDYIVTSTITYSNGSNNTTLYVAYNVNDTPFNINSEDYKIENTTGRPTSGTNTKLLSLAAMDTLSIGCYLTDDTNKTTADFFINLFKLDAYKLEYNGI
jgi:hypothetical protein